MEIIRKICEQVFLVSEFFLVTSCSFLWHRLLSNLRVEAADWNTCTFCSVLNKTLKSATQRKLNPYSDLWLIKTYFIISTFDT